MRQGYRLNLSISELSDCLRKNTHKVHNVMDSSLPLLRFDKDLVNLYYDEANDYLSAEKINEVLFPDVDCDVFVSYSHMDIDAAKKLAQILYEYFGVKAFVDVLFWHGCDELQRILDDKHSRLEENETLFDYNSILYSTAHVHMLLAGQLLHVIERSDCFFLLGTSNSLIDNNGKIQSSSPWIYFETLLYEHLMHNCQVNIHENFGMLFDIPNKRMVDLTLDDVDLWSRKIKGESYKSLDILYDLFYRRK